MKKLSTKLIAMLLAVMMVMTSAPYSAMASTTAANSVLTALSDEIDAYRAKMNGQKIYTNMAAAYSSYIEAVRVYDKAKYGAQDVTQADIEAATSDLNTKTAAMTEWTSKTGTARPSLNGNKGFNADSNTNTTVNSNTSGYTTGWRPFADATGNAYVEDVYSSTYQNLGYVQTGVSSTSATWTASNCTFGIYIPNAVIIYDGSNGFKARVGVMAHYYAGPSNNKKRKVAQIMVNGNDYVYFGDNWLQNAKSDGDTNFGVTSKYTSLDFVGAIGRPSPTDRASGNSTADTTGTRQSAGGLFSNGDQYYIANYLEFTVPSTATAFDTSTATSYSITSIPIQSKSGDTTFNDTGSANVSVSIQVLNYKLLLDKMNSAKLNLRITEDSPYLEGGLSNLITAMTNAENWDPNGQSNITTLVNTMNSHITNINNATVTADDSPYGALATKMGNVLSTSGTLGDWYNVNHDTGEYTDESIDAFVTAFTYAQSIFDQNATFADSYSFSASSVTVGSGDTAKTVSVPAGNYTVTEVYNMLVAAQLVVSERVDVTTLVMYIEELYVALKYADAFGFKGSSTEENMENAVENAKYQIWGETTLTDDDTGETYTVSNYGNSAKLPKDSAAARRKVQAQETALKAYIDALAINPAKTIVYNEVTAAQNSLTKILQDMADTNLYPRENYINGDTLDEAISYVNNNFVAAVIPNENTTIYSGIVLAKVNDYKSYIQYCQNVIDALQLTFLALDNGTIINQGSMEVLTPSAIEDKWALDFARYNNVVVFRTTKQKSTLNLGSASLSFTQGDTTAWFANNEYRAVLDSISINDTAGASASINKENAAAWNELPTVALSDDQIAQYPGCLSMSTTNGGIYGVANFAGIRGKDDGAGGYLIGSAGADGSLTSGLAVTDGTMGSASGIWAYDSTTTLVAGNAYLDLAAEDSVTLTRTTTPKSTVYTNTGYFGSVFYWVADGAGMSIGKAVYNGYYHERTSSTYTQTTTVVDISNLKELVGVLNTLNKSDYTEASWNNMKTKLAAATSNDFGSGATYRDLTTANLVANLTTRYQNLYDAWKGLVPAATNIELTRPVAQANNEGKDIGAVVRANDNVNYTKYNTNNNVTAENAYGTYTTNTWNAFAAAYEAGDVAIFGDGTNAGIYATPAFDTNGNATVVGTRQYARFINSDGDPLDIGDLDALGLTINDIEAVEQQSGVSLSTAQAEIVQLAANIRAAYAALKQWATFAPVDSAMTALDNVFASNYNRVYTVDSLNNINTTFAGLSTNYYTVANNDEAQHALVNGVAVYDEDDNDAITAEATAINGCIPPMASTLDLDTYTPSAIIARAEAAASDPDAYDAAEAVQLATTLSAQIFQTVNIVPEGNLAVEGVNFDSNDEIEAELTTIMSHIQEITYDVVVKDESGNVLATFEDQPYGTSLSVTSQSGNPVDWTYTYESRTIKNHTPTKFGALATFEFVVVGDTTITEGAEYGAETQSAAGHKVVFNDNLNHVYAIEYVQDGASVTYGATSVVLNYGDGESKEITPPSYAFYNLTGFNKDSGTTIDIDNDTVVTAEYAADEEQEGYYLKVCIMSTSNGQITINTPAEEYVVNYNDKVVFNENDLRAVKSGKKTYPGKFTVNGEDVSLVTAAASVPIDGSVYAFTVVNESDYEAWVAGRAAYSSAALGTETPASLTTELTYFPDGDSVIAIYIDEDTYNTAVTDGFINANAHANIKPELVLTNSKFTMHGTFYIPNKGDIIECGILMYLGSEEDIEDALTLTNYINTSGAYRLKYTKSREFNNINVSVNRANMAGKTVRVRYRSYVTYKVTENGKTVNRTVYSGIADDTQAF